MSRKRERRRWGQTEGERARAAQKAACEVARERGAFIMEADEHRLALIERFGVTALRAQLAENASAYRKEVQGMQREHARRTMADALVLARERPSPSFRIVFYAEPRRDWFGRADTPADVRRRRAHADLAKLGLPVEYVNPNEAGDST